MTYSLHYSDHQSVNPYTINQSQQFIVYLVADGNQVQLVKIPSDVRKRPIFRNQVGHILQATLLHGVSIGNQPIMISFETNEDSFRLSNSSLINTFRQPTSITSFLTQQRHKYFPRPSSTVQTSSLFHIKRTIMRTQQSTNNIQLPTAINPTSIRHGCTIQPYDRSTSPIPNDTDSSEDGTSDESATEDKDDHLSSSKIIQTNNHHHHSRLNNSSLSKEKCQRSRSCEHDSFMYKRIRTESMMPHETKLVSIPEQTTTMPLLSNSHSHKNDCSSFNYSNQHIPSSTHESFHRHNSLSNNTTQNEKIISQISSSSYPPTSTPRPSCVMSTAMTIPNIVLPNCSSIKSFNETSNNNMIINNKNDCVEYTSRPAFSINYTSNNSDKIHTSNVQEKETEALRCDPKQWTTLQVKEFIVRLTNSIIAEIFVKHQINGESMLMLDMDILLNIMKINLGPALLILRRIVELRENTETFI
ncbi:unnamed protein product [Rotaria sp. Silwood2]|nr:unnamed protein product [Rotaria sp. Silwood2]CAF4113680.1 unnamed protein product [Rotaria sp. Silwood2]